MQGWSQQQQKWPLLGQMELFLNIVQKHRFYKETLGTPEPLNSPPPRQSGTIYFMQAATYFQLAEVIFAFLFFWLNYFGFRYEIFVNLPVSHIFYPKKFHYNQTFCQTMSEICLNYLSNKVASTQFDRYLNGLHGKITIVL